MRVGRGRGEEARGGDEEALRRGRGGARRALRGRGGAMEG